MLGVGTLFRYKFAEPEQHIMRYGIVKELSFGMKNFRLNLVKIKL